MRAADGAVAVVGLACRLPGTITTPTEFWELLHTGTHAITLATPDHPRAAILPAGILSEEMWHGFDHAQFGLAPEEAAALDPQQRWGLELVEEALQHAGIAPTTVRDSGRVGVWWGSSYLDHAITALGPTRDTTAMTMVDTAAAIPSMVPGRISRAYHWHGPSEAVDTACSGSLVALHRACQALRWGEVDLAVVGGANGLLLDTHTTMYRNSGTHSPTGQVRPFDAQADGFVRGEGAVVVILQRLDQAHQQGSPVRAHVRASATGNDGNSPGGVGAPSHRAQARLMHHVYTQANIAPDTVDYVQAHGTATPAGDNAERAALDQVLGQGRTHDQHPLWLGSTKSVVGHLEGAAGLVSLLAAVLALDHETIPPTAGHTTAMAQLGRSTALRVPTEPVPWPTTQRGTPRYAAINATGFTGTNAHIVLAAAPQPQRPTRASAASVSRAHLVPISAAGPLELAATAQAWGEHLHASAPRLDVVAATAQHRRDHHPNRAVVIANDTDVATAALKAVATRTYHPAVVGPRAAPRRRPRVVFVYPGHGHHDVTMGRRLAHAEPEFAQRLEVARAAVAPYLDHEPWTPDGGRALQGIHTTQPAAVAHQIALTALWAQWGVTPDVVVGHSAGEAAAAHAAGILTLDEVARLVAERSRLLEQAAAHGTMAAIGLNAEQTQAMLAAHPHLSLAAINGPHSCVVAGPHTGLDQLGQRLQADGITYRLIPDGPPAHNPHILGAHAPTLATRLRDHLNPQDGACALHSTTTGHQVTPADLGPAYWQHQLLRPVLLHPTIAHLTQAHPCVIIVMGARPVLAPDLAATLASTGYDPTDPPIITADPTTADEHTAWLGALAEAHTRGIPPTWPAPAERPAHDLPPRTWARPTHPSAPPAAPRQRIATTPTPDARTLITDALSELISPVLAARHGHPVDLDPDADLTDLGLESLTMTVLRHKITQLDPALADLPLTRLLVPDGATTLAHLTDAIEEHLTRSHR